VITNAKAFGYITLLALGCALSVRAHDQPVPTPSEGRQVSARTIPVPADVSQELQDAIRSAGLIPAEPVVVPRSPDEWRSLVAQWEQPERIHDVIASLTKKYPVSVSSEFMGGVATHTVMPVSPDSRNRNRAVLYVHGGGYVAGGGEAGLDEAILLAHYTGIKVIAVDYRMPPDHPFPAALDDAVAVWKQITGTIKPANVAIGGTSAGGGLALAIVLRLEQMHLPLPGAVFAGTPWADLTNSGDSARTNDGIDDDLSGDNELLLAAGKIYAGSENVQNPLISPLYGDFKGFPPTILITGTRDFLLSDTVRVHRKLREAGVVADLNVFEAMSHGQYVTVHDAPESREAYMEVAHFFGRCLGR
jgi:monoterpene epsilon-lactone hydrolase